ncbi:hypothetical protein BX600DRAFT_456966 [Xylariales sp. PMI_506]|nr:hypothetical protein BX600DRAFT_456966 [Xylariales sp. PMI_506]
MSHPPSTPVKVPGSAATYTPATLDADLRSQINTLLLRDGHIEKIQERLLHTLNSHSSNWPTLVQAHAVSLLRSGEVSTFPALIRRVLEDVRQDTQAAAANSSSAGASDEGADGGGSAKVNGATTNGNKDNGAVVNGTAGGSHGLAMPNQVVEEVLRVARESLEAVCEIDDAAS